VKKNDTQTKKNRWFDNKLTDSEFRQFVDDAINGLEYTEIKQVYIGDVDENAAARIKAVCGERVTKISADNGQIRHAYYKAAHNLESDDILHINEVINTTTDISLSGREFLHNKALLFKKDISGEVTFLVQLRPKYDGWLAFADCWRKKKKR
jgi:hypothetical protein